MPLEPAGDASALIEPVKSVLRQLPGVRLAILFGSAARGTRRPHGDVDVGVSLDDGTQHLPTLAVALERATGRRVDLVPLDTAPPLLRFEMARDGVLLVEREPHLWADFRARAMIDWWDWAPTARMMHDVMTARLNEGAGRGPS
jgi:predicted nucleotidyltransferase